jgi:hypothetical protein
MKKSTAMNNEYINQIKELKQSIIIVQKERLIYQSKGFGLWPLYHFYKKNDPYFPIAVYDKVTGTGAARILIALGNVELIYTNVITENAYTLLKDHNITVHYDQMVKHILNKAKNDLCPVEKISLNSEDFSSFMNNLDVFYLNVKDVYEKSFLND